MIPTPSLIIDLPTVKRNIDAMPANSGVTSETRLKLAPAHCRRQNRTPINTNPVMTAAAIC